MKVLTRALSTLCAVSLSLSMAAPAFSADVPSNEDAPLPPATEISYGEILQTISEHRNPTLSVSEESRCFIPKNVNGNQGMIAATFTADGTTVDFCLKSLGGGTTYYVQLYKDNGSKPDTKVTEYDGYPFGRGLSQSGLEQGDDYYIMISSDDVPGNGVNCQYVLNIHEH